MIYVHATPIKKGRANLWRVFADTNAELRDILGWSLADCIEHEHQPNEHVMLNTSAKNSLKGAVTLDDRGLVRIIRRKRANPPGSERKFTNIPDDDEGDAPDAPDAPDVAEVADASEGDEAEEDWPYHSGPSYPPDDDT